MVPCIGAVSESPDAAAPAWTPPERRGAFFFAPRRRRRRATSPPGRTTSSRLPPTSTTTLWRSPASSGASRRRRRHTARWCCRTRSRSSGCARVNGSSSVGREGRVGDDGAVERQHRRHALDVELGQRPAGALERLLPVAAGHDELGQHRVERAADDVAGDDAGVEPDARPGRRARRRATVPGAGRKPRPASSPLIRNSIEWPRGRGVVVAERLAVGDAELLADQVDAGDLLGDRVLDLQAGVDLEEGDGAVLADEELAGARRRCSRPRVRIALDARTSSAFCSSERNGAGASSTSFWWRRCSEQSRVETTTTLPWVSARHWVSTCRGWSR